MSSSGSPTIYEDRCQERSANDFASLSRREGENSYKKARLVGPASRRVHASEHEKNESEDNADFYRTELTTEEMEMVSQLVEFQAQYESFSAMHLKEIPQNFPLGYSNEDSAQRQRHLVEIIANEHWAIKAFFQHMPGSTLIPKEDRTPLLKAHINTLLMLRWARKYDPRKDAVRILPGRTFYSREHLRRTGHGGNADAMFDFFKRMHDLKMDTEEYALMHAVVVFTACPGLKDPEEVQKHYKFRISTLRLLALQKSQARVWEMQSTLNQLRAVAGGLMQRTIYKKSGNKD